MELHESSSAFMKLAKSPARLRLFLFSQLPSAYFSGVRIKEITGENSKVTVPYKWFSKNPFKSTYFACLAMAAELSTGILCMMNIYRRKPGVSMLVTKMEAAYYKKATGITTFVCNDGIMIKDAIEKAIDTREPQVITASAVGTNALGEAIATFTFTWSFKAKL